MVLSDPRTLGAPTAMSQPEPPGPPAGGILKSNVDTVEPEASKAPRKRRFPLAPFLGGMVLLISGVAAALLLASSAQHRPTATPVPTRPPSAAAPMAAINAI